MKYIVSNLKNKIYWLNVKYRLYCFFKKQSGTKYLLYGYPKSGNTWVRFLIFNYFNLINSPQIKSSLTFDELNSIQSNVMDRGSTNSIANGFPFLYRTHKLYNSCYDLFDFKIFVHRNPVDTLVSSYYFYRDREVPFSDENFLIREKLLNIDFYVKYKFPLWKEFYEKSIQISDFTINYSDLKKDTYTVLLSLIKKMGVRFCNKSLKNSINLSSFEKIKKMSEVENQRYGNGPNDGTFKGNFLRSGEDGQFINEVNDETLRYIKNNFRDFENIYDIKYEF